MKKYFFILMTILLFTEISVIGMDSDFEPGATYSIRPNDREYYLCAGNKNSSHSSNSVFLTDSEPGWYIERKNGGFYTIRPNDREYYLCAGNKNSSHSSNSVFLTDSEPGWYITKIHY